MAFSDNLRKIREARGITATALADAVGIAPPQISKYEAGVTVPNAVTAVAIADKLGTTVEILVKGES